MKIEFPRITRARLQIVNSDSKDIGDGSNSDPTEEERAWIDIMRSEAPELAVKKKRLSVCALADITEYNNELVKFSYDGTVYTIKKPVNSLQIARARETSVMDALEMLNIQRCILIGAVPIPKDFSGVSVEVIQILSKVAENFFFTPYL
ncbi:MAG: hypothetical protein PHN88_15955 [Ignavibacteria bacterium]|nr:hypothetical protein [Ignavibacteria bacterium]